MLCTKSDSSPHMENLRITFATEKKHRIHSVAAIRAPCSMQKCLESWKGQRAAVHLQKWLCSVLCARLLTSSPLEASLYVECFGQMRCTALTVFAVPISCSEKSKETRYAHLLVAGLCIFVYISTNKLSVMWMCEWWTCGKREASFSSSLLQAAVGSKHWHEVSRVSHQWVWLFNRAEYSQEISLLYKQKFQLWCIFSGSGFVVLQEPYRCFSPILGRKVGQRIFFPFISAYLEVLLPAAVTALCWDRAASFIRASLWNDSYRCIPCWRSVLQMGHVALMLLHRYGFSYFQNKNLFPESYAKQFSYKRLFKMFLSWHNVYYSHRSYSPSCKSLVFLLSSDLVCKAVFCSTIKRIPRVRTKT